jgi:hypothetical protein
MQMGIPLILRVGHMTGTEAKVKNIGSADSPKSLCFFGVLFQVHFTYEKKKSNLASVRPWGPSSNPATDINYGYRYREGNQPHVGFVPSCHIEHVEDLLYGF